MMAAAQPLASSSPSPSSSMLPVGKLRGGIFTDWQFRMKLRLVRLELWDVVDGSDARPEDSDAQRAWDARSMRALAEISDHVSETDLVHIRRCTSGREAWLQLNDIYEPSGLACQVYLNREFRGTRMEEGENAHEHFAKMRALKDELDTAGQPTPNSEFAYTLLSSLPPSYEPLVREISALETGVTPTLVISTVLREYERRQKLPGPASKPASPVPTRPIRKESDGSLLFAAGSEDPFEPPRIFTTDEDDGLNPFEPPRLFATAEPASDPFEPPRLFATAPEASNDPYEPPRLYRNPASDPLEPPRLYGNTDQPSATSPFEPPRLYSDTAKVTVNSPLEPPRLYADSDNSPNRPSLEPERLYTSRSPLSSPSAPPMSHLSVFSTSSPLDAPRLYTNSAPVSPLLYSPGVFEAPRLYGNVEGDDDDHPGSDPTTPTAASMAAPPSERSTLLSFISPVMYSPAVRTPRSRTPSPVANSSRSAGTVRINPEFPLAGPYKRDSWYLSSAATHHVTPRRPIFSRFEVLSPPVKVIIAGVTYDAEGQGDVHVVWDTGEWKDANAKSPSSPNPIAGAKRITHRVLMRNVRYVPTAPAGFVAVGPLQAKGIVFEVQGMGSTDAERVRLHADGRAEVPGREYCLLKGAKEKGGALMGKAVKDGAAWRLLTVQS